MGECVAGDCRSAGHETGQRRPAFTRGDVSTVGPPWDALRRKYDLISPGLEAFVGLSFQYADYSMRYGQTEPGPPSIVSTVRINKAGFTEMMDTEVMFRKWFSQARSSRLLP